MTERQLATYSLIKKNSLEGKITTQRQLFENYPISEHKDGYVWNDSPYNHDNCSQIWRDIVAINFNDEISEIVVVKNFTYKIAKNKEDAEEFATSYLRGGLRKMKRYWQIIKKIKLDGQGRFTELEPHIEFINSFVGGRIND